MGCLRRSSYKEMTKMPVQTQESKRAGMEAFLEIFEEFESAMSWSESFNTRNLRMEDKIAMFAIYVGRME